MCFRPQDLYTCSSLSSFWAPNSDKGVAEDSLILVEEVMGSLVVLDIIVMIHVWNLTGHTFEYSRVAMYMADE